MLVIQTTKKLMHSLISGERKSNPQSQLSEIKEGNEVLLIVSGVVAAATLRKGDWCVCMCVRVRVCMRERDGTYPLLKVKKEYMTTVVMAKLVAY